MSYRNDTLGARAIHLTNGSHVLVEPGATADVPHSKIRRLAPGLIEVPGDLPPVPKALADKLDHDGDGKAEGSTKQPATSDIKSLRAEYEKKLGKKPFNGWNAATLKEKIAAA